MIFHVIWPSQISYLYVMIIRVYPVHIRAPVSPYQTNTDRCTHISLYHHYINTIRTYNMFQPSQGHLQGVWYISAACVNEMSHQT